MNILVIGTGAVGSFYGSLLARQGADVSVMARSDYSFIREQGIDVHSETALGDYHFHPVAVLKPGEVPLNQPDYVLLCTKVVEGADRVGLLRSVVGSETRIVLISNGVEIEAAIRQAYPQQALISGLAFVCVSRIAPGKIRHQSEGRLVLGDFPSGLSPETRALADVFGQSGIRCQATPDIITARWQKCVWNAAFNPLSVLSGGLDTASMLETGQPFVRVLMEEICRIAAALGHPLSADLVDRMIENTRAMPPYKTSMLLDFEAGRALETEAILGNAVRAGRRAGVSIPHLESVYALMQFREKTRLRECADAQGQAE